MDLALIQSKFKQQAKRSKSMSMNKLFIVVALAGMLITAGCCCPTTGKKGSCGGACGKVPAANTETVENAAK